MNIPRLRCVCFCLAGAALFFPWASTRAAEETLALPPVAVTATQVANETPAVSFAMPVSGLRFEPRVDVQARNLPESQADISIRGGIFENTGFKVGALSLFDPQTGHYFAEIPIAPAMLLPPRVLTGLDNALTGFNAGVGTVAYDWRAITTGGEASVAVGDFGSNRQSLYDGFVFPGDAKGLTVAADFELARSESDGSVPFGDHNFRRVAGRLQIRDAQSETDFYAGGQRKFFGWPDLYTPFGVNETENLHTELFLINHREWLSPRNYWQVGAYYRHNYDDYEFDRSVPGEFNPYQHTTAVRAVSLEGHGESDEYAVDYSLQAMRDRIDSTALVFGHFNTRDYYKLAVVPEREFATNAGKLNVRVGATYDHTNRDGSALSPVVEFALTRASGSRWYLQYAESTQVPTYTALNSNATSGLFRGNPNLGRETNRNLEAGVKVANAGWTIESAVFYRWDDDLVDWTFLHGVTARTANPVDIGTIGVEVVAAHRTPRCDLVLSGTYLNKSADYGPAAVDASFYALNFARYRLTAAVTWRLGGGFEIRSDNQYRDQEKNLLRVVGGDHAVLSALGVYYRPPQFRALELSAQIDNLWDERFQEVPAVPAARRQYSFGAAYRW